MKKDQSRLTPERMLEIVSKHTLWLMIAWATGGAWVLYFADAPTLVINLATGHAPAVAYIWIAILTFTTYTLAGHMREQVCVYMCPWPRIQAALTDEWALNVTYKYDRGEPRISAKKAEVMRAKGEKAGDCVDCGQCVAVCPTGVDIRHGSQLGCIQCGLCIDACNNVMAKIGREPNLIAYDNDMNIHHRERGEPEVFRLVRARTLIYVAIIALVSAIMLGALLSRSAINVNVLHDRNPVFVTNSDGSIRNGYTLRVFNTHREDRIYTIVLEGLASAKLEIVGETATHGGHAAIAIGPDQTRELRVLVVVPAGVPIATSTPVTFKVTDTKDGAVASRRDNFIGP